MICRIYSETGRLVLEGACGVRRDGDLEVVPLRAERSLHFGEGPLLVVEGSRRYPARVSSVHSHRAGEQSGTPTTYHLTPLVTDERPAMAMAVRGSV